MAGHDQRDRQSKAEPELAPEDLRIVTSVLVVPAVAGMSVVITVIAMGSMTLMCIAAPVVVRLLNGRRRTMGCVPMALGGFVVTGMVLVVPRVVAVGVVAAHRRAPSISEVVASSIYPLGVYWQLLQLRPSRRYSTEE
ncbi:hypothetical protein [Glycomyces halotolerans]